MLRGIFCIQRGTGLQTACRLIVRRGETPPEIEIRDGAEVGKILRKSSSDKDRAFKPSSLVAGNTQDENASFLFVSKRGSG
jgi:hypothetical protein